MEIRVLGGEECYAKSKTPKIILKNKHIKFLFILHQFSSVQSLSHVQFFATHELQHARPPCPSSTPRDYSNSCPLSR